MPRKSEPKALHLISVKNAMKAGGWCRSKVYQLIGAGKIIAVKDGRSTKIDAGSIEEYQRSLPRLILSRPQVEPPGKEGPLA